MIRLQPKIAFPNAAKQMQDGSWGDVSFLKTQLSLSQWFFTTERCGEYNQSERSFGSDTVEQTKHDARKVVVPGDSSGLFVIRLLRNAQGPNFLTIKIMSVTPASSTSLLLMSRQVLMSALGNGIKVHMDEKLTRRFSAEDKFVLEWTKLRAG